jgi:membrane protease YdiL (CAAX protease family)
VNSASADSKETRWFELALVLFIALGGSIFGAISVLVYGPGVAAPPSNLRWLGNVVHEAGLLLLLGYVLWRGGRRFSDIGFRWSLRDAGVGVIVFVVTYLFYRPAATALYAFHRAIFGTYPHGPRPLELFGHATVAALLFSLLNPFFEELVVRAYLMTEVIELTGSPALAVLLSVAVQFSYHLYYGWWTASILAFQFLVWSLYYSGWRRALPIIVAHGFFDVWGVIRLR